MKRQILSVVIGFYFIFLSTGCSSIITRLPVDQEIAHLKERMDNGDANAAIQIGNYYVSKKQYCLAKSFYERAAGEMKYPDAYSYLGELAKNKMCYAVSDGKPIDIYKKGCEQGSASCLNDLGVLYANGEDVVINKSKAREYFEEAARRGNADGKRNLGLYYAKGEGGLKKDLSKASKLIVESANIGGPIHKFYAATFYGELLPKSYDNICNAAFWMEKAVQSGYKDNDNLLLKYKLKKKEFEFNTKAKKRLANKEEQSYEYRKKEKQRMIRENVPNITIPNNIISIRSFTNGENSYLALTCKTDNLKIYDVEVNRGNMAPLFFGTFPITMKYGQQITFTLFTLGGGEVLEAVVKTNMGVGKFNWH